MPKVTPEIFCGVARDLHQPRLFEDIISGRVRIPNAERILLSPFPPALIPLWSTGAGTIVGLWKHWISSDRLPTFVEYYGTTVYGQRNMAFEYGRTLKQVIYRMLSYCIMINEGMSEEILECAAACGIYDINEVEKLLLEAGDERGLQFHPEFSQCLPLSLLQRSDMADYSGDFPTSNVLLDPDKLRHACVPEVHSGFQGMAPDLSLRRIVANEMTSPDWFRTSCQNELFQGLLDLGEREAAWMCLNSPEWRLDDAKLAITKLANFENDSEFHNLAKVWTIAMANIIR